MHHQRPRVLLTALLVAAATTPARPAAVGAQAWSYPAFQTPRVAARELNFGIADGSGTSLIFQWREGRAARSQLSLDLGVVTGDNDVFLVGGQYGYQLARADANMPLDFMLTVGANGAFNSPNNLIRVPVGVSLGHRFPLEGLMAITPWVHPRLSIDHCSECDVERRNNVFVTTSRTDANFVFDLGGSLEFTPTLAVRVAASLGGGTFFDDAFGVSLAWTPGRMSSGGGRPPRRG